MLETTLTRIPAYRAGMIDNCLKPLRMELEEMDAENAPSHIEIGCSSNVCIASEIEYETHEFVTYRLTLEAAVRERDLNMVLVYRVEVVG